MHDGARCILAIPCGRPPFLSPRLLRALRQEHGGPLAFSCPVATLAAFKAFKEAIQAHAAHSQSNSLKSFFGLGDAWVVLSPADAQLPIPGSTLMEGLKPGVMAKFYTGSGNRVQLNVEEDVLNFALLEARADAAISPFEAYCELQNSRSIERAENRSLSWAQIAVNRHLPEGKVVFLPVLGTDKNSCLNYLAKLQELLVEKQGEIGFSLPAMGEIPRSKRSELFKALRNTLGPTIPIFVEMGALGIAEIVEMLGSGAKLISTNLAFAITKGGHAFTFCLDINLKRKSQDNDAKAFTINLHDLSFSESAERIAPRCSCWTCERHTRAYLHHLLKERELLGEILLFFHNASMMLNLFAAFNHVAHQEDAENFARKWTILHN